MQCPTDGTVLVMSERSGIEIDYCPTCRGVWLDRGELDKIIDRSLDQAPARPVAGRAAADAPPGRWVPAAGVHIPDVLRPASQEAQGELAQRALRLTARPPPERVVRGLLNTGPMEYAEVARAETERGELVLRSRRTESAPEVLELRANGVFVMDTAETASERALASAALDLVDSPATVLVGGLGLGFTMREVLDDPRVERCTVVEIEQSLVDWMRDGTIPHGPAMLADERLNVVVNDVALAFAEADEVAYDLVLLDVDNGPGYLVHDTNALLYRVPFLRDVRRVTRQALVIWSAATSAELEEALAEVFDEVRALPYDVRLGERSETYWLYVARVASAA